MKENDWISVEDRLPKIGQMVQVKGPASHSNIKVTKLLKLGFGVSRGILINDYGYLWDLEYCCNYCNPAYWRPIQENSPDFSKLKNGDFIIIEYGDNKKLCVTFCSYEKDDDLLSVAGDNFFASRIRKITLINLEEKKFEEI